MTNIFKNPKRRKVTIWVGSVVLLLCIALVGFFVYVGDFYKADDAAIAVFEPSGAQGVGVERTDGALVAYPEGETIAGFIFYPGGKVEYDAYEPLMREIASHGVLCV